MITWLDEYTDFCAQAAQAEETFSRVVGQSRSLIRKAASLNFFVLDVAKRDPKVVKWLLNSHEGRLVLAMSGFTERFYRVAVEDEEAPVRPCALQISPLLAEGLGMLDECDERLAEELVRYHGAVYVDFLTGCIPLGPRKELRAIFLLDTTNYMVLDPETDETLDNPSIADRIMVAAIIGDQDKWSVASQEVYCFAYEGGGDIAYTLGGVQMKAHAEWRNRITMLAKLALIYYKTGEEVAKVRLPRVKPETKPTSDVKQAAEQEKREETMFVVTRLYPPGAIPTHHLLHSDPVKVGTRDRGPLTVRYEREAFPSHRWSNHPDGTKYLKPVVVKAHPVGDPSLPWSTRKQRLYELMPRKEEVT